MTREVVSGGLRSSPGGPGAEGPGDAFGWRVSIATIDRDAPFSCFSGYDRTLIHIAGGPLLLTLPDRRIALDPGGHLSFAGEAIVAARVGARATVLNVMSARTGFTHSVERLDLTSEMRITGSTTTVIVALTAGLSADDATLHPLDAILLEKSPTMLSGAGTFMMIDIRPRD